MEYAIFDKKIQLKEYGCYHGHAQANPIPMSVNLFVKVTNGCNVHCKFCSNGDCHKTITSFNHEKLWQVVDELLRQRISVNRINITGGEPAVVPGTVRAILEKSSEKVYSGIHLHLNTNGLLYSSQELMREPRWDSISVSLHHYDRDVLSEIYGCQINDNAFSFEGIDLRKVNASCNLIRGYIDSANEVERMLKFAVRLRLPRLGFVALMKVNDFCQTHYIDFDSIDFANIPHLYFTESRNRGADCKCSNYLYNHSGRILEVYMRNYANPSYCESSLMYDGEYLRQGFHDNNIIF